MRASLCFSVSLMVLAIGCDDGRNGVRLVPDAGEAKVVQADVVPVPDALPAASPDVLAADLGGVDLTPSADVVTMGAEAGLEVQAGPEAGVEVRSDVVPIAAEAGAEAQADGPPPLPPACVTPQVKVGSSGLCNGQWPGSSTPCMYGCQGYDVSDPCHDAPASAGVECKVAPVFTDTSLMCNSYRRISDGMSGYVVVCLRARELCDVYCPAAKGG